MAKEYSEHECKDECCEHKSGAEVDVMELQRQIMQQQLAEMQAQLEKIESQRSELNNLLESINEIKEKKDSDLMIPVGAGILARGKLVDGSSLFVNVGAGVMVKKSAEETKKIIEKQFEELDRAKKMFEDELVKYNF